MDSCIISTVSAPSTVCTDSHPFIQSDYVGNHMHHYYIVTPIHANVSANETCSLNLIA